MEIDKKEKNRLLLPFLYEKQKRIFLSNQTKLIVYNESKLFAIFSIYFNKFSQ